MTRYDSNLRILLMQKAQPFKIISILTTIIHDQHGCRVLLAPFSISAA
ncbi:hypothetical protein [Brevibacillus reuszeri]|nr:hypothetical protein [Brevibacillus reuszeri]